MDTHPPAVSALQSVLHEGVQRLREGANRVLVNGDLDGVHLLRTTARRLRAGVKHLGRHLDRSRRRALSRELRWFMRSLGPVRDLDVFLSAVGGMTDLAPTEADRLRSAARRALARKAPCLRAVLEGTRFAQILSALDRCASEETAVPPAASEFPSRILVALWATLSLRPESWENAEAERLHGLRKSIKRLRYTLEACEPSFGRPVRRLIERCRALQETLGAIQDVATFRRILGGKRSFAAGQFLALAQARVALDRVRLPRLWQKAFSPARLARLGAHLCRRLARPAPASDPVLPEPLALPPAAPIEAGQVRPSA